MKVFCGGKLKLEIRGAKSFYRSVHCINIIGLPKNDSNFNANYCRFLLFSIIFCGIMGQNNI